MKITIRIPKPGEPREEVTIKFGSVNIPIIVEPVKIVEKESK